MNRIGHDQLFKQVLEAFFPDFLRLFDPATAAHLDLTTVTFRSPEVFTDIPQGERRTADVVAEVRSREGEPEQVLGAGLASVMRLPGDRPAQIRLHLACLRRVLDAERSGQMDAARAFLLGNLVATYLPLTDEERDALRVQLEQEGDVTMDATE